MPDLTDKIQPGLKHEREWVVADSMLYSPGGDPSRATLSSPSMINELETTAMLGTRSLATERRVYCRFPRRHQTRRTGTSRRSHEDDRRTH